MHRHGLRRETIEIDERIWEWSVGVPNVTKNMIQEYAKKLFLEAGILTFKASDGWYRRWKKRWKDFKVLHNTAGKESSKVPDNLCDKQFLECVSFGKVTNPVIVDDDNKNPTNDSFISRKIISQSDSNVVLQNLNNNFKEIKSVIPENHSNNLNKANKDVIFELCSMSENNSTCNKLKINQELGDDSLEICLNTDKQFDKTIGESFVAMDNFSSASLSNTKNNFGFQVPRFSLSSELFDEYSLLETGDEIFCKNCGDFHVDDYRCRKLFISNNNDSEINNHGKEDCNLLHNEGTNNLFQNEKPCTNHSKINVSSNSESNHNMLSSQERDQPMDLSLAVSKTFSTDFEISALPSCNFKVTSNSADNFCYDKDKNGIISNSDRLRARKKGERYLPQFKSKVVTYAKAHSIKSAASKFSVYEGTISEWVRAKRGTEEFNLNGCQNPSENAAEMTFIKWLCEIRNEKRLLSKRMIKDKLSEIMITFKMKEQSTSKKNSWLTLYFERLLLAFVAKKEEPVLLKKHIAYPVEFKIEVAMYAKKTSQQAAASVFGVARKRVFEWLEIMKQNGTIISTKVQGTSYVTDAAVDQEIWSWYSSQTTKPSSFEVRAMGRKLYEDKGHKITCSSGWFYRWRKRFHVLPVKSSDYVLVEWILGELDRNHYVSHLGLLNHALSLHHDTLFKASNGWAIRFCKRYTSLLRKVPTIDTALPPALELNVTEFRRKIKELKINLSLEFENIGTVDEIPIHFIHSGVKKKELLIRRPGFENCQGSVILASLADGTMLPSVLVLKGTSDLSVPSVKNILVFCRKDGCVDKDIMLYWLKNVWFRCQNGVSLLLSDRYSPHMHHDVKELISTSLCHHELFPPGCSCKLQPLGLSVADLFKEKIKKNWLNRIESLSSWNHDSPYLNIPSPQDIFTWVALTHQQIASLQKEKLKEAFQKTLLGEHPEAKDYS